MSRSRTISRLPGMLLATGALLCLMGGEAPADTVLLKATEEEPERRLIGTVTQVTASEVILKMPDGVLLPLSRQSVHMIRFGPEATFPTQSAELDSRPLSAPVPASPPQPLVHDHSLETLHRNLDSTVVAFPDSHGKVNDKQFITLSRFTGHRTGSLYAGLYNFSDKGTFWIYLNEPSLRPSVLNFSLYGKKNDGIPTERFAARARFIDANGLVIGESPLAFFNEPVSQPLEWFRYLENVSGLGGQTEVHWMVPAQTRSIEIRAEAEDNTERHLVGYLGNLVLRQPQ